VKLEKTEYVAKVHSVQ